MDIRCANCQTWLGDVKEFCSASLGTSCFGNEMCHFTVLNDDITEYSRDGNVQTIVCPECVAKNIVITYEDGSIGTILE